MSILMKLLIYLTSGIFLFLGFFMIFSSRVNLDDFEKLTSKLKEPLKKDIYNGNGYDEISATFYLEDNPQRYRIDSDLLDPFSDQVWKLKPGQTISIYVIKNNRLYGAKPYVVCGLELEDSTVIIPLEQGIRQLQGRLKEGIIGLIMGLAILFWCWKKGLD
ncbi:MAG: hypothetical protein MK207_09065 [Saprospiraceae bacterium]|nr:hypothetical protein [Saprospiraceae bacterium]